MSTVIPFAAQHLSEIHAAVAAAAAVVAVAIDAVNILGARRQIVVDSIQSIQNHFRRNRPESRVSEGPKGERWVIEG